MCRVSLLSKSGFEYTFLLSLLFSLPGHKLSVAIHVRKLVLASLDHHPALDNTHSPLSTQDVSTHGRVSHMLTRAVSISGHPTPFTTPRLFNTLAFSQHTLKHVTGNRRFNPANA